MDIEIRMTTSDRAACTRYIIDRTYTLLVRQGGPSIDGDNQCLYRCGDRRCAVGHWVPDAEYTDDMEGVGVAALIEDGLAGPKTRKLLSEFSKLFDQLQTAHDIVRSADTLGMSWADTLAHNIRFYTGVTPRLLTDEQLESSPL